ERGAARRLRAGRNAARDPDRVLIVLPFRDRDPSARARLLGPALFLATAGDGDARNVNLWSAWCRFVPVQFGMSSAPSAQDERHRQERARRPQAAQSLRADDRVA